MVVLYLTIAYIVIGAAATTVLIARDITSPLSEYDWERLHDRGRTFGCFLITMVSWSIWMPIMFFERYLEWLNGKRVSYIAKRIRAKQTNKSPGFPPYLS